jgi:nitrate reductase NapE component
MELCEKKEEVMLDEKMSKVAKGEKKRKKRKNIFFMFLRFYVERA